MLSEGTTPFAPHVKDAQLCCRNSLHTFLLESKHANTGGSNFGKKGAEVPVTSLSHQTFFIRVSNEKLEDLEERGRGRGRTVGPLRPRLLRLRSGHGIQTSGRACGRPQTNLGSPSTPARPATPPL